MGGNAFGETLGNFFLGHLGPGVVHVVTDQGDGIVVRAEGRTPATLLATIQSQPLRNLLAWAFSLTASVSAANPTTKAGRPSVMCDTVAKMSGFSTKLIVGTPVPDF